MLAVLSDGTLRPAVLMHEQARNSRLELTSVGYEHSGDGTAANDVHRNRAAGRLASRWMGSAKQNCRRS
jgi:hypothetical protein